MAFPYQKRCELFLHDVGLTQLLIRNHELMSPILLYNRIASSLKSKREIKQLFSFKNKTLFHKSFKAHVQPLIINELKRER